MDKYIITIEFVPDTTDPDAYRLHRQAEYEVKATECMIKLVREFELSLKAAKEAE